MKARRSGRGQLLLLVAIGLLPIVLASSMYRLQFWVPASRTYHGDLIGNGQDRTTLGVEADEVRWQLLVTVPGPCQPDCRQLLYLARQVHIGLGRNAVRVSHGLASAVALEDGASGTDDPQLRRYALDLQRYRQTAPDATQAWLWIVDPHGNLVLRYPAAIRGQDVLRDLQHLLKLSNIG